MGEFKMICPKIAEALTAGYMRELVGATT